MATKPWPFLYADTEYENKNLFCLFHPLARKMANVYERLTAKLLCTAKREGRREEKWEHDLKKYIDICMYVYVNNMAGM